jgi:hypothetical protein
MAIRIIALFIVAISAFFLQRAATPLIEQNAKVKDWPSQNVTVQVTAAPPNKSGVVDRIVEYRQYIGEGNLLRYFRRVPHDQTWLADGGVPELPVGMQLPATLNARGYANRAAPDKLFFPKSLGFRDYAPLLLWTPLAAIGFGGLVIRKNNARYRASGAWGAAIVCGVLTGFILYDYLTGTPRVRSTLSDGLMFAGSMPALLLIAAALHFTRKVKQQAPLSS